MYPKPPISLAVIKSVFEVSAKQIQWLHVPGHQFHYRMNIGWWKDEKKSLSDKEKNVCPADDGFVA